MSQTDSPADLQLILSELLADGLPTGMYGKGIDPSLITPDTHIASVIVGVQSAKFEAKSNALILSFKVAASNKYVAMPILDLKGTALILSIHHPSSSARAKYGAKVGMAAASNSTDSSPPTPGSSIGAQRRAMQRASRELRRITRRWYDARGTRPTLEGFGL